MPNPAPNPLTGQLPPGIDTSTREGQIAAQQYFSTKGALTTLRDQHNTAVNEKGPMDALGAIFTLATANRRNGMQALVKLVSTAFMSAINAGKANGAQNDLDTFMKSHWGDAYRTGREEAPAIVKTGRRRDSGGPAPEPVVPA